MGLSIPLITKLKGLRVREYLCSQDQRTMPVRCHNKERFGPWLLRQINHNQYVGVRWLDEGRTLFRLPWKHLNIRKVDETDYAIFKAWAIQSGKYNPECEDQPSYKTNFRCALKAVYYRDQQKMFTEVKDNSTDPHDPHKIFKFNGVHDDSPTTVDPSAVSHSANKVENFQNEMLDEDYRLRISPDVERSTPFINRQESGDIEQLLRNVSLDSDKNGAQQVFQIPQDDYSHNIPRVDQVFIDPVHTPYLALEEPYNNGQERPLSSNQSQLFHDPYSQYQEYDLYQSGHIENLAAFDRVFQQIPACPQLQPAPPVSNFQETGFSEVQTCQYVVHQESTQHMMNEEATTFSPNYTCNNNGNMSATQSPQNNISTFNDQETASQETAVHQASTIPKLTSWEATVFYRGKEVLKQNVSTKFYITHTGCIPQSEVADIVTFPSTRDTLVNQLQIDYTDQILNSVGTGLLLEVNPEDYKLYATRMGNARVYWSMSESLETKKSVSEEKKLHRNFKTGIFDFNQFWRELIDYKENKRSSPDYTLYLSFGQSLFEPIKKALVVVKLVPSFCTFWHQIAQQQGASSLQNELISLQISNTSSFNSHEMPCLMDFDLSYLPDLI